MKNYNSKFKNILLIDSSDNKSISVAIKINETKKEIKVENARGSQILLKTVDNLLKENNLTLEDLNAIEVNIGPGSFTGIRVGMSIANALGFALNIPVNGKKAGELVEPVYK